MQKFFTSVLPKRVYPVSLRTHSKYAQRKPAKHKKTSRGNISERGLTIVSITYNWKQRGDILASEEALQLIKVITPTVINHLS